MPYVDQPPYATLLSTIVPRCRAQRIVQVEVPTTGDEDSMDVDQALLKTIDVPLNADGILLYVRESYYESGTSPLCVWISTLR